MPSYLHPGVYIEEIPSGSKPIEGIATSTAAFIGPANRGPAGEATLIQSLDDYKSVYGNIASEEDAMGLAVQAFYLNGGKSAYICRLMGEGSEKASATVLGVGNGTTPTSDPVLIISASSEGEWGNDIYFRIVKPDQDALSFDLEIGHQKDGKFRVDETFSGLTMREDDDEYVLTQVNGHSAYVTIELGKAAEIGGSSEQYQNATLTGGTIDGTDNNYFKGKITAPMSLTLNINGQGAEQITIAPTLGGTDHDDDGRAVADAIKAAVKTLSADDIHQKFTCSYDNSSHRFKLTSPKAKSAASIEVYSGKLAKILRLDSKQQATLTGTAASGDDDFFSKKVTSDISLTLNIDNHGDKTIIIPQATLILTGKSNQEDGGEIAAAIQNAVRAINPKVAAYKEFSCKYESNQFKLVSGSGSSRTSSINIIKPSSVNLLDSNSLKLVAGREMEQGTARVIPKQSLGLNEEGIRLKKGSAKAPTAINYEDFYNKTLRKVRDVSIIVLPGEQWAADGSGNAKISQTLAHCEATKNRLVIIDPPKDTELDQKNTVQKMDLPTSTYAVLYYPWIQVANPFYSEEQPNVSKTIPIAPSAFAAGMWAKIDGKRGVWKAPAGVETQLLGAAGLEFIIEDGEQDFLNPLGINAIRRLPSFGSVIWGSRTLATKADPEWRYIPVRRTAIFIEQSIYNGIQWAVFEPNDHPLWGALRANIGSFMNGLFRAGAFQGKTANDAYFVRCGLGDTMTQGDIDRGQVIVIVGFAPLKPAEFVIVKIQQKVAQQ
jgi:phage tail sheath protein FI